MQDPGTALQGGLYSEAERQRRDETPWTLVQGILAPIQFVVFLVSPLRLQDPEVVSTVGSRMLWLGWAVVAVAVVLLLSRGARPALIVLLVLMLFSPGFIHVQKSLADRYLAQRGELMLYPWRIFGDE
ncbi:MAG: 2-vinyl bacteriochlorophyllide hydratase, partial [Limibacillus sp.]